MNKLQKFLQYNVNKLWYNELSHILWISITTIKSYISWNIPRKDVMKKMLSNYDVWISDLTDRWIDVCDKYSKK